MGDNHWNAGTMVCGGYHQRVQDDLAASLPGSCVYCRANPTSSLCKCVRDVPVVIKAPVDPLFGLPKPEDTPPFSDVQHCHLNIDSPFWVTNITPERLPYYEEAAKVLGVDHLLIFLIQLDTPRMFLHPNVDKKQFSVALRKMGCEQTGTLLDKVRDAEEMDRARRDWDTQDKLDGYRGTYDPYDPFYADDYTSFYQ